MDIVERLRTEPEVLTPAQYWEAQADMWHQNYKEAAQSLFDAEKEIERLQQWVNELELLAIGLDDASIKCCKLEDEIKWLRWALRKIRGALGDPSRNNMLPHEIAQDALDGKW